MFLVLTDGSSSTSLFTVMGQGSGSIRNYHHSETDLLSTLVLDDAHGAHGYWLARVRQLTL